MEHADKGAARILIVDDLEANRCILEEIIQDMGCRPVAAASGEEALRLIGEARPRLILSDISMPGMDGYELCRALKNDKKTKNIPIIFISAYDNPKDIIEGFSLGGADYITKPFSVPILIRKIAAVLRRSSRMQEDGHKTIVYRNLILDCDNYTAAVGENVFELTPREFEVLKELLTNQGRILTRQNLLDKLWRYDFYGDERVVDTHIKNLRKKLGIDFIQTIRGVGYKIDKEH